MQGIGLFFTGLALVFGGIVGINVYQGGAILKDARAELASVQNALSQLNSAKNEYENGLGDLKSRADKIMNDAIHSINLEAKDTLQEITKKAHRNSTLETYITRIHAHLDSTQIDEDAIYPLVTALFGYRDLGVLSVYQSCFDKLPAKSEIISEIVKHGLKDFSQT